MQPRKAKGVSQNEQTIEKRIEKLRRLQPVPKGTSST